MTRLFKLVKVHLKRISISLVVTVVAAFTFTYAFTRAGSLTPSASPGSTMRTLLEVYDSIASTTFDSSGISASQTGSLIQVLKFITANLPFASSSGDAVLSNNDLNIVTGVLQLATTTRIDNAGRGTFTTSTITFLTISGTSTFSGTAGFQGLTFTTATGTTLNLTNFITTNGTSTNFNFTTATGTTANIATLNGTNFVFTNGTSTNFNATTATTTNLRGTGFIFTNGTSTNFNFTTASGTNLTGLTTLISTNATTTNLNFTTATGTTLTISTITSGGTLTIGNVAQLLNLQGATTTIAASSSGSMLFTTQGVERMRIASSGNIGIATTTPRYALVIGDGTNQDDVYIPKGGLCVDSNNAGCPAVPTIGTIYASTTAITAIDLAENYPTNDTTLEAGDLVAIDISNPVFIAKASAENKEHILGAISTAPGVLLGRRMEYARPVALAGRVPVKVNDENGPIKIGDPITLSSTPGVGMKGGFTQIIGYALQSWQSGTGKIEVFVRLGDVRNENAFAAAVLQVFKRAEIVIENGIIRAKEIFANIIHADKVKTKELEIQDNAPGGTYCVRIVNGEWLKTPGDCDNAVFNPAAPAVPPPIPQAQPEETTPPEPVPVPEPAPTESTEPAPPAPEEPPPVAEENPAPTPESEPPTAEAAP